MLPVTEGSASSSTATAGANTTVKDIAESLSKVLIDPNPLGQTPEINQPSKAPRSAGSPIQLAAKAPSASAKPLSRADQIRHDGIVRLSKLQPGSHLKLATLPMRLDQGTARATGQNASLLRLELSQGLGDHAIDLFSAIGEQLCAADFQEEGLRLWQKLLPHVEGESSLRAGVAWFHAAQVYQAAGDVMHARQAYGRALDILGQPQLPLRTSADVQRLPFIRERLQQLEFESVHAEAEELIKRNDADAVHRHLMTKVLIGDMTPRRAIQSLQVAASAALLKKEIANAVQYYEASARFADARSEEFSKVAGFARAAINELRPRLKPSDFEAALAEGSKSQAVLDKLLVSAAHGLGTEAYGTAAGMLDQVIPRLIRRGDMELAVDALKDRRSISFFLEDGQTARFALDLASVHLHLRQSVNAALCLTDVLADPKAIDWLPKILKASVDLLKMHGLADAVKWCQEAQSRPLQEEDVATLDEHLDSALQSVVDNAAVEAEHGSFESLLKYAENLVENDNAYEVPAMFSRVIELHDDIDAFDLAAALDNHLVDVAGIDEGNIISAGLRLALADYAIKNQDLASAAESLQRALDVELTSERIGACLHRAARIASDAGEARNAAYFLEAAQRCETGSENRSDESEEWAQSLTAELQTRLTPEEMEAARQDARKVDPTSDEMLNAVDELIERMVPQT